MTCASPCSIRSRYSSLPDTAEFAHALEYLPAALRTDATVLLRHREHLMNKNRPASRFVFDALNPTARGGNTGAVACTDGSSVGCRQKKGHVSVHARAPETGASHPLQEKGDGARRVGTNVRSRPPTSMHNSKVEVATMHAFVEVAKRSSRRRPLSFANLNPW